MQAVRSAVAAVICVAGGLLAGWGGAAEPTSPPGGVAGEPVGPTTAPVRPATDPGRTGRHPSGAATRPAVREDPRRPVRRFQQPTPDEIAASRAMATAWFEQARRDIAPALHLVETRHFLIFTAYPRDGDGRIAEACETMYSALCRQFAVPPGHDVWVGKCAIYAFAEVAQYKRFTNEVDKAGLPEAGGYHTQRRDGLCYIVLNRAGDRNIFHGILVHEGTHAFLARYHSDRDVPDWVGEGLAEYMAGTLAPDCPSARRHLRATAEALKDPGRDLSGIFADLAVEDFDYGIAQSLVRFLIARDRRAFIRFIHLLKDGADDRKALREAYGLTRERLLAAWRKAAEASARAAQ